MPIYVYVIFAVAIIVIAGLLVARLFLSKVKGPTFVKAALLKVEKEYEHYEIEGKKEQRLIKVFLTFQDINSNLLNFTIDESYTGSSGTHIWGDLTYKSDNLIKFTCEKGTIKRRMFK